MPMNNSHILSCKILKTLIFQALKCFRMNSHCIQLKETKRKKIRWDFFRKRSHFPLFLGCINFVRMKKNWTDLFSQWKLESLCLTSKMQCWENKGSSLSLGSPWQISHYNKLDNQQCCAREIPYPIRRGHWCGFKVLVSALADTFTLRIISCKCTIK